MLAQKVMIIFSPLNIEVLQYKKLFIFNPCIDDLNARDISLAAVGKGANNKIVKTKLDILGTIKDSIGLSNR